MLLCMTSKPPHHSQVTKNDKKRQPKIATRIPETWKRTTSFLRLMASNNQAKTSGEGATENLKTSQVQRSSRIPSKVPFRAQKVLVIFQASQKLAKNYQPSSDIKEIQRISNDLLCHYVELSTQRYPKSALERLPRRFQRLRKQQIVQ